MKKMLAILLLSISTSYLVAMEQQPDPTFQQRVSGLHNAIDETNYANAYKIILECPQAQRRALVNTHDMKGRTSLIQITFKGWIDLSCSRVKEEDIVNLITFLLHNGADPSVTDTEHGATALAYLLVFQRYEWELAKLLGCYMKILRLLLANPQTHLDNIVASGRSSALHIAATNKTLPLEVYQLLFTFGASTLARDAQDRLPIDIAEQRNNTTAINFLTSISARMFTHRLPETLKGIIYEELRK